MSALKVKADLDGRICVLTVTGDLDCLSVTGFLTHAARVVDERTERFVLDLGGVTFLDAAGARALGTATHVPPSGCPVIIRSLSAWARRVLGLMNLIDLDLRQEPWNLAAQAIPCHSPERALPRPAHCQLGNLFGSGLPHGLTCVSGCPRVTVKPCSSPWCSSSFCHHHPGQTLTVVALALPGPSLSPRPRRRQKKTALGQGRGVSPRGRREDPAASAQDAGWWKNRGGEPIDAGHGTAAPRIYDR